MDYPKLLISGSFNVFNEGWDGCGVYMCSGNYISETFKLPIYIGGTERLQERIETEHISTLNKNKHPHNPPLQFSWNKHSEKEGFVWWLLEVCEPEKCFEVEQKYLDLYRPFVDEFRGFNISHKASSPGVRFGEQNGFFGKTHTQETKDKISKIHKGKVGPWRGKKLSKEHIENSAKARKGIPSPFKGKTGRFNEKTLKKMSESRKGKRCSEKTEFKKGQIPWNQGKMHSEEIRKNISQGLKESPKHQEAIKNKRKKVICVETGVIYDSITEASKKTNISSISNISLAANGKLKTCGGYHWKLVENK